MTFEESIAQLDKKLMAFGAREQKRQLAEGWSQDEEGRMIPPGWVRAPESDQAGAASAAGEGAVDGDSQ